jgi:hypothetical protein
LLGVASFWNNGGMKLNWCFQIDLIYCSWFQNQRPLM